MKVWATLEIISYIRSYKLKITWGSKFVQMSTFADALSSDGKYPKICVDNKQVVTTDHLLEQSRYGGEQISISDVTPASGQTFFLLARAFKLIMVSRSVLSSQLILRGGARHGPARCQWQWGILVSHCSRLTLCITINLPGTPSISSLPREKRKREVW